MRLWLSPSTEVSIRDQLVRQISLGVLSGEIGPGERLPSVRALARRFDLHRNTVSAAYRQLKEEKWVHSRRGSGVYVSPSCRSDRPESIEGLQVAKLEMMFNRVIEYAQEAGIPDAELHTCLENALNRPKEFLFLESDRELARLVLFEIVSAGRIPPEVCYLEPGSADLKAKLRGRVAVVMPSKAEAVKRSLGQDASVLVLHISPVSSSLAAHLPESRDHLVAIASHWPRFLDLARTLLISVGFQDDALIVRQADVEGWTAGLTEAANVVCDSLTRTELPPGARPLVFFVLNAAALQHFPRAPGGDSFESGTNASII
jgi:DNA-binding transcriptional regulator YhcF (GntR family)